MTLEELAVAGIVEKKDSDDDMASTDLEADTLL